MVLANLRLSIVIRRPWTLMLSFATRTKRLRRWKKSARSKNSPPNLKVSGTSSRPGAVEAVVPAAPVGPVAPVAPVAPAAVAAVFDWLAAAV